MLLGAGDKMRAFLGVLHRRFRECLRSRSSEIRCAHNRQLQFSRRRDLEKNIRCLLALVTSVLLLTSKSPLYSQRPNDLAALPTDSWLKSGGNLFNQNYSPLTQINRQNIANMKGVWRVRLDGSGANAKYSGEAQPIVHEGVVFIVTGADDVFAISVKTGQILWKYQAKLDEKISTVCCGWTSRGLALGEGKIYVGQLDGHLVALDEKSGKPVWSIQAERWQEGYTITAAPLYFDGRVIVGFAGGENGTRGRVKAYDAEGGRLMWTFYTIPGPGEIGHETWPQDNDAWKHGGATIWQTPAVDPELGLIYFTTGNPGPDFNGRIRRGDNLFSVSVLAVEAKTGKYRWHFQQVHHDIWDYDSPNPVILFDVKINGRIRKAVAEASKTGWVYILDRTNGKPLIGIDEKAVPQEPRQLTSATQPFPRGDAFVPHQIDIPLEDYPLVNQGRIFTPFWTDGVVAKPAPRGGANWPPSSYDPATNYFYVCGTDSVNLFKGGEENQAIPEEGHGGRYLGGAFGGSPIPGTGIFAALDMKTNRLVWQQRWRDVCYSGSVTTAGGLVFVGRNDGRLTALDSSNGRRLWEFQTGAGVNAPAAVFQYEGEEYIVVYSAGNLFAASPRGDSVWLFSLKGTIEQVPAPER
ncbi:MAG: quinonprotein alcohol dehydrogenase [Acidobacteria bacterium]|nr:MAG: quinonprotein alcohol dehydrogenase [Acidobacteriota bacterium]